MNLLSWIIVGGLAGWIANKIMHKNSKGCFGNIILGVLGAMLGGFVVGLLGGTGVTGINIWSIFVSLIGAILFIWVVRKLKE